MSRDTFITENSRRHNDGMLLAQLYHTARRCRRRNRGVYEDSESESDEEAPAQNDATFVAAKRKRNRIKNLLFG